MEIIITQWGLDSYLELRYGQVFSSAEYWETIRPDVLRLQGYPQDPKFQNGKFWSVATDDAGAIPGGFKMKWHQMGSGLVQIRLPVGMMTEAFLCEAYVKQNAKQERRRMARFKVHLALIEQGRFTERGRLS